MSADRPAEPSARPSAERIWLTGLMGAGKSTVGPVVASVLGWDYVDNDVALALRTGRSLARWQPGEGLHEAEEQVLAATAERAEPFVAGVAAGCIERPKSLRILKDRGFVVYLHAPVELLAARVRGSDRPRDGEPLGAQYARRDPLFRAAADLVLDGGAGPGQSAAAIVAAVEKMPTTPSESPAPSRRTAVRTSGAARTERKP